MCDLLPLESIAEAVSGMAWPKTDWYDTKAFSKRVQLPKQSDPHYLEPTYFSQSSNFIFKKS